jgi:hypothetical protein
LEESMDGEFRVGEDKGQVEGPRGVTAMLSKDELRPSILSVIEPAHDLLAAEPYADG